MSSDKPLVTIAIPTYNRAATYLPDCLKSAFNQTYANLEIIVADNGSTDNTAEVVNGYRDSRIRYFRQPTNIVPNDNFNFCLNHARGDYFQLLLDDELIDVDFVETCIQAVNFHKDIGVIRTGLRTIDANGMVIGQSNNDVGGLPLDDLFLAWFAGKTTIYQTNTLFNRKGLIGVGGFRSKHNLFQDVMAHVKVAARMPRVDVSAIKATTRLHQGQFTYSARVEAWCEDSLDLLELMCSLASDKKDEVRESGSRFFAMIGYSRANAIRSPYERLRAYALVHRLFGRRHLPPPRMVFQSTAFYRVLRQAKRRLRGLPAWAD